MCSATRDPKIWKSSGIIINYWTENAEGCSDVFALFHGFFVNECQTFLGWKTTAPTSLISCVMCFLRPNIYIYIFIYWFIYLSLHSPEICPTSESNYSLSGWVWLVRFRNAKPVQSQLQKILTWSAYVLSEQPKAFFVSQNEIRAKPWALHIGLCSCDKIAFGESNCCEFGHGSKNGDWGPLWTHNFDKWLVAFGLWIWKRVFLLVSTCPSHDHLEPWIRKHSIIYIYMFPLSHVWICNKYVLCKYTLV